MIGIDKEYGKGLKISSGKGEYIQKRISNRKYEQVCLCVHNIDLSAGCISNEPPGMKRNATKYNCDYCYARRTNYHDSIPYKIDRFIIRDLEKEIKEKNIKYIRLGKTTECGNKKTRENLIKILELGGKHNVRFIMPTKHLEFNKTVAYLFKQTDSILGFSIGADKFELGCYLWGFNNKFREKQAVEYLDYGVNTTFKVVTDITVNPEEAAARGWYGINIFNKFPKEIIQIIPVRIKGKEFAFEATKESWDILQAPFKGQKMMEFVDRKKPRCVMEENITVLIANEMNSFYNDYKEHMCGHIGTRKNGLVLCDKCNTREKPEIYSMSMLPPSPGSKKGRSGSGNRYYNPNNWNKIYKGRSDKKYQVKMDDLLKEANGEKNQGVLKV